MKESLHQIASSTICHISLNIPTYRRYDELVIAFSKTDIISLMLRLSRCPLDYVAVLHVSGVGTTDELCW